MTQDLYFDSSLCETLSLEPSLMQQCHITNPLSSFCKCSLGVGGTQPLTKTGVGRPIRHLRWLNVLRVSYSQGPLQASRQAAMTLTEGSMLCPGVGQPSVSCRFHWNPRLTTFLRRLLHGRKYLSPFYLPSKSCPHNRASNFIPREMGFRVINKLSGLEG